MDLAIDIRAAMRDLTKSLRGLERDQIPFATALTLTAVARDVAAAETDQLSKTFSVPTPFTLRAFRVIPARKTTLTARVFAMDRQAAYLEPYLNGGRQVLFQKKGMLTPADVPLNAYGNLTRGKLKSLKARPDVFIGKVQTKSGAVVDGVWRRPPSPKTGRRHRGQIAPRQHLQLLILFTDPKTVKQRLPYHERATKTVDARLRPAWEASLAKALASRR